MIGSKYIEINWKNFVQGITTADATEDGGLSIGKGGTTTTCFSPLSYPGLLFFPPAATDKSTNLTGSIIASCEDPAGSAARLFLSAAADQDGTCFSCDSTGTLTLRGTEDTGQNYVQGKTDMIGYKGRVYVTGDVYIMEWQQPATLNKTFFDFSATYSATASVPHPAIVYEDNAYYGNGNLLMRQTSAGGAPTTILTLPSSQIIVALGIDPASGKMLISVVDQINISNTVNSQPRVLYYNGYSSKVDKVVLVDEMITCFYNVGGTVFLGYGQNFGYWTGTGIQFLRRLDLGLDNTELLYKHRITNIGNIIYIVEQDKILAFGEVMQGQGRSWWYAFLNAPAGTLINMTFVTNIGNNLLSFSYATSQFFTLATRSTSTTAGAYPLVFTRKYDFPRNVTFNSILIEYSAPIPANKDIGTVVAYWSENATDTLGTVRTARTDVVTYELPFPTKQTRTLQFRYVPSTDATANIPIERITIFYNDKE